MIMTVTRIAMWSGPRNISTAMMRSFENRPDTVVWDEPFYAAELLATGHDHPMCDEVIAAGPTDPQVVVERILGPICDPKKPGATIFYQKHMTQHMLPDFPLAWIDQVTSAFLIRDPARVLASYTRAWDDVSLEAIGLPRQVDIFNRVADRLGHAPAVIDTADVLCDPRGVLGALCEALGIPFMKAMLAWPRGRRASDGIWAPAWYASVEASTGFSQPADASRPQLEGRLAQIAEAAQPLYEMLRRHRLRPHRSS
ncbi:MAG: hypothetical protein ACK5JT_12110 [Hyphomicrobiaceae bacterium]